MGVYVCLSVCLCVCGGGGGGVRKQADKQTEQQNQQLNKQKILSLSHTQYICRHVAGHIVAYPTHFI